jgi:diguanylate cyclase (GGDEF)-like protein
MNNPIAIFIIDINDFKEINDKNGHPTGDKILINIAHILDQSLRPEDILARIGGDEFGIALPVPETKPDKRNLIPDEIIERIAENINIFNKNSPIKIKLSIGYEISPNSPHDLDTTINLADQKMYLHKADQKELKLIDGAGI